MAWTAYGISAAAFYFLAPRYFHPRGSVLTFWHLRYSLILIGVYAVAGAVAGAVSWCVLDRTFRLFRWRAASEELVSAAATISLAFAITLNYFPWPFRKLALLLFGVQLFFLAVVAVTAFRFERRNAWWPQVRPWIYSCVAISAPWMIERVNREEYNSALDVAGAAAILVAVALVCRWAASVTPVGLSWGPLRRQMAGLVAVVLLGGLFVLSLGSGREEWLRPPSPASGERTRPDIVLITLDTVRADHTSIAGYDRDTTPALRRLAESATSYPRAIAVSNMTLSTHASMLTGLYPRRHGANFDRPEYPWGRPLNEHFETIAEALSLSGYVTAAVVANYGYLHAGMGFTQGFDLFDSRPLGQTGVLPPFQMLHERWKGQLNAIPAAESQRSFLRASEINERASRVLGTIAAANQPFFLFLNYMDAHDPCLPPAPFDTLYPGKNPSFTKSRYEKFMYEVMNLEREPTAEETAALISQYDGAIAYMDSEIEKLISTLKRIGRFENTILIVTSDHGEAFGRRNTIEHGIYVYQNEIAIPLVIKYPGQSRGEIDDSLVSQVDIATTILSAAGLDAPGIVDGRVLQAGAQRSDNYVISQSFQHPRSDEFDERFQVRQSAIVSEQGKFIRWTSGQRELYDLRDDPQETRDIHGSENAAARALEARLDHWLQSVAPAVAPGSSATDEETLQRLRSLGYIK